MAPSNVVALLVLSATFTQMDSSQYAAQERYLQAVRETVSMFEGRASDASLAAARHLIDHNESGEGLLVLAWTLHDE